MKTSTLKNSKWFLTLTAVIITTMLIMPLKAFAEERTLDEPTPTKEATSNESTTDNDSITNDADETATDDEITENEADVQEETISTTDEETNPTPSTEEDTLEVSVTTEQMEQTALESDEQIETDEPIEMDEQIATDEPIEMDEQIATDEQVETDKQVEMDEQMEQDELLMEEPLVIEIQPTFYNAVCLSGLTICNGNYEQITVSVTNTRTGEVQQGYMSDIHENTLLGHLTTGAFTSNSGYYKIEVRAYGADGSETVVRGTSIGCADAASGYVTISFMADRGSAI